MASRNPAAMIRATIPMLAALALAACAPALPMAGADPANASATTGPSSYRSPFKDYVTFRPVDPRPWRETNDRVRDLGGPDRQMQADSEDEPLPRSPAR